MVKEISYLLSPHFFGSVTSIQAEVHALIFGGRLCISRGYVNIHIEMDSLVLAQILKHLVVLRVFIQRFNIF